MEQLISSLENILLAGATLFFILFTLILGIILVRKLFLYIFFRKYLNKHLSSNEQVFLSIKIPPTNKQNEEAMESFLKSLHRVLSTGTYISLEMVSSDQFLKFYIVIPISQRIIIETQLYAQYPDAEIEETDDYLAQWSENSAIVSLKFKHNSMHPIKTHKDLEESLLKNLSAALAKTEPGEKAIIQLTLKRVGSKSWEKSLRTHWKKYIDRGSGEDPTQNKLWQDLYLGKLRIAYSAESTQKAKSKLKTLINLLKSVKGNNELKKPKIFTPRNLKSSFKARAFETGDLWSVAEIATIYHFPYHGSTVSNIVETNSKRAPAPDILPFEGLVDSKQVSIFGETN